MEPFYNLIIIAVLLFLAWLVTRNLNVPAANMAERRNLDFYRAYNETEDRTETMFDRRQT